MSKPLFGLEVLVNIIIDFNEKLPPETKLHIKAR
jgi:hypothetical protein